MSSSDQGANAMASETNEQLLKTVRMGVPRAYLALFDRYYSRIERYAHCLLQDADGAARAASSTFGLAFRKAHRKRANRLSYPAELYVICRRTALRGKRRKSDGLARQREPHPFEHEQAAFDELSLSTILCRERDALIQSALNNLQLLDRDIIYLAFEPDLDQYLVASILKTPVDSVTARLYQALQRLGSAVRHAGYERAEVHGNRPNGGKLSART
jgi:DNA-directed RNA polymerase specialized sigma24 family protein